MLTPSLTSLSTDAEEGGDDGDRHHHGPNPNRGGLELNRGGSSKRLDIGGYRMERTRPSKVRGHLCDSI